MGIVRVKMDLECTDGGKFPSTGFELAYDESAIQRQTIAASGSWSVNLGTVTTASFVAFVSNRAGTVSWNGGTAVNVVANQPWIAPSSITSLTITNSDGSNAATVVLWPLGT